ncbi:hypothetical protein P673_1421 [Acinetobacter baumannii UH6507]|nr:hypothetical protein P673_1421 [Acinetobacter baumannii UH6507]OTN31476.1 hypothetical protein B9Y13_07215 [Acinetobacter baumannii]
MLRKGFFIFLLSSMAISNANAFEIYQYLRWHHIKEADGNIKYSEPPITNIGFFESKGLKKMNVVYSSYILTDGKADPSKIKKIVENSKLEPNVPICFDIEMGNGKNADDDLPVIIEALKIYKEFNGKAPIGVYAVLPQRIVQINKPLNEQQKNQYVKLNKQYESLARYVDFLSPTLYFYSKKNTRNWNTQAALTMAEARKYADKYDLKIYPFVSLSTWDAIGGKSYITPVSEIYMTNALLTLKKQGADGVVLWESAAAKSAKDKQFAIFDTNKDSFKAVINFSKKY